MAPAVTAFIVSETGSFSPALILGAVIACCSACSVLFVVRKQIANPN
jgi:hypothetical protein